MRAKYTPLAIFAGIANCVILPFMVCCHTTCPSTLYNLNCAVLLPAGNTIAILLLSFF
ncbi:MAG: hypothetical protein OT643_12210 [Bacteroidetes bacterium]|nr:hypothetical protein [Bacteroidota bacterium]